MHKNLAPYLTAQAAPAPVGFRVVLGFGPVAQLEFLLKGDVFTEDVIDAWIENKIERDLNPVRLRPTPPEFALYFDTCGWKCGRAARRGEVCCDGSRQLQAAFAGESRAPADAKHGARASRTGEEDKEWRTIAIDKSCVT